MKYIQLPMKVKNISMCFCGCNAADGHCYCKTTGTTGSYDATS